MYTDDKITCKECPEVSAVGSIIGRILSVILIPTVDADIKLNSANSLTVLKVK